MRKIRVMAALCVAFLLTVSFNTVAYAGGGPEESEEPAPVVEETPPPPNPFTPAGTGTVIDNAADTDGKEFFTIMTPDENVFYLVIDRQRETENVYFLNAVTEKDLLALAEKSGEPVKPITATPEPETPPAPESTPEPAPEPQKGGNAGLVVLVVLLILGGGAGWYFKIYRPKQQQADTVAEFDDYSTDPYGEETEENLPSWDMEDEDKGGDGEE